MTEVSVETCFANLRVLTFFKILACLNLVPRVFALKPGKRPWERGWACLLSIKILNIFQVERDQKDQRRRSYSVWVGQADFSKIAKRKQKFSYHVNCTKLMQLVICKEMREMFY